MSGNRKSDLNKIFDGYSSLSRPISYLTGNTFNSNRLDVFFQASFFADEKYATAMSLALFELKAEISKVGYFSNNRQTAIKYFEKSIGVAKKLSDIELLLNYVLKNLPFIAMICDITSNKKECSTLIRSLGEICGKLLQDHELLRSKNRYLRVLFV